MALVGSFVFGLLLWLSVLGVACVFLYEVYMLGRSASWLPIRHSR